MSEVQTTQDDRWASMVEDDPQRPNTEEGDKENTAVSRRLLDIGADTSWERFIDAISRIQLTDDQRNGLQLDYGQAKAEGTEALEAFIKGLEAKAGIEERSTSTLKATQSTLGNTTTDGVAEGLRREGLTVQVGTEQQGPSPLVALGQHVPPEEVRDKMDAFNLQLDALAEDIRENSKPLITAETIALLEAINVKDQRIPEKAVQEARKRTEFPSHKSWGEYLDAIKEINNTLPDPGQFIYLSNDYQQNYVILYRSRTGILMQYEVKNGKDEPVPEERLGYGLITMLTMLGFSVSRRSTNQESKSKFLESLEPINQFLQELAVIIHVARVQRGFDF